MNLMMIYDWIGYLLLGGIIFFVGVFCGEWHFRTKLAHVDPVMRYHRWAATHDWTLLATGASGSEELEKAWLRIAKQVFVLFCEKQHDYGPKNIAIGGLKGIVLRISDKVSRLWELTGLETGEAKDAAVDETLDDALLDVADYGIIGKMVKDGSWPLLSVDEAFGRTALLRLLNQEFKELSAEDVETLLADTLARDLGAEVVNV